MAETAVVILFDKLHNLLVSEVGILGSVHDEVERIKNHLALMNAFLNDADREAELEGTSSKVKKEWVKQCREVAFPMEDVVDRYLLKVAARDQRHGVSRALTKGKEKAKSVVHRHDIASKIGKIEKTIEDLMKRRGTYVAETAANTSASTPSPRRYRGLRAHFAEESQLVGIKPNRDTLNEWLKCRTASNLSLKVNLVVGPPGIGKTTIVKNVYYEQKKISHEEKINKKNEMHYFEFCAWITMPHPRDDDKLFKEILQQIQKENASAPLRIATMDLSPRSIVEKIKEYLKDKRYLIVFDEVRDSNFWSTVKIALPNNSKSSRVIITTRDEGVADGCDALFDVYKLKPLSKNDALKLFHLKAFQSEHQPHPKELDALSEDFVKKCNGIPLAIVAIAGLLSTKNKTFNEWQKVNRRLGSELEKHPQLEIVQQVMSESYYDLPSHLKPCLLYFGLFPEDYSISCMRLIRLWVAEGFVTKQENEDTPMEEFAGEYLDELFRRCLVQVSQVDFNGKPRSCHVHHLMHNFIAKKCEQQSFCQVMKGRITGPVNKLDSVPRRLSIQIKNNGNDVPNMERAVKWSTVRSCFVFDDDKRWLVTKSLVSSFKLLIGLDLCGTHLDNLPEEIGNLLNLKYLNLRNTNIRSLPKSIGNLENLQTLDLKQTRVHELPEEIKNLTMLRHLLAYYVNNQHSGLNALQGVELKKGLQNLTSLQKLSFLEVNALSTIEELKELKKLRKLGIIKLKEEYGEALCRAIESMAFLCSLSIGALENDKILLLQSLMNPPLSLERLYLNGRLQKFPSWISKLPNLIRLYLKWSGLKEDPLHYLQDLSKLLHLELYDTYAGEKLHFKNGWLRSLKVLSIESMPKLKTIKIDKGALHDLGKLKIGKCHEMVQVPSDVKNLMNLKKLYLYDMPEQFVKGDFRHVGRTVLVLCSKDDHFVDFHDPDTLNE
ncbi:Virus X resistance protein-like, coiled-coil domain [Sesbania bispinosa]|nr:Virus X resistance protein-like, coiled-coil domain [Sesbania bispinosa]